MNNARIFTSKHLGILVIGVALALVFVWIVRENNFSASVLSLAERETIQKAQWDAAYKKTTGDLELFITPQLQTYDELFVSLLFSPSKIQVITDTISSPYAFNVLASTPSSLLLTVSNFSTGNVDEGILTVPFSGDQNEITIEYVSNSEAGGQLFAVGFISSSLSPDEKAL
ncbi:MAG: hypothetical protein LBU27_09340 [Candidatus Peribacteria bacterium]|jgi:hypothetical protein|nr:hypothetical protein [Candidatus Peribacteria bacterium]